MTNIIAGSGGGKGGSSRTPREAKDNLHSTSSARIIDLISEGEIGGLANGTDSIFLDDTPLTRAGTHNFQGVTVSYRYGTQKQDPLPGFPAVENGQQVGVELTDSSPWIRDFTNPELSAVRVQLSVPSLSKINTSNGDTNGFKVNYAIDLAVDGGPFREVVSRSFSGKTTTKYERSHDIVLPEATDRWTIRVRRTTPQANSSTTADRTYIDAVTEIIDGKFSYPNSAVVGIEVSAEHFQGIPRRAYDIYGIKVRVPDNYDPVDRTYTGVWSGGWKIAWTNNPAWIFMDLATHPRYGLGDRIPVGMMDKWALYDIARYCDQMVPDGFGGMEPRFTCNTYIQSRENAYDVLQKLASVFQGMAYYASGIVTAVADQPKSIAAVYTNSKVIDGRFIRSSSPKSTRYTVALVGYNDQHDFFNQRVEYVEDRAGYLKYGHQETQLTAFGCSSRGQAHRAGKWALLTSQIETGALSFSVGLEGVLARPGDVIQIMDQDLIGEHRGGLISEATKNTITTDCDFEGEPGDTLTVVLPSGLAEKRTIQRVQDRVVTVTQDFTEVPHSQSSWAIDGAVRLETYRVLSIVEKEGGTQYEFKCIQYAEEKFDAIAHGVRLDPRPVTALPPSIQPPPTNVTISQRVVVDQGIANTVATISWEAAEHAVAYEGMWRKDEGEWIPFARTGSTNIEIPNIYAGRYLARVHAINALDIRSTGVFSEETLLGGKTTPPPVITHLITEGKLYGVEVRWGFPPQGAEDVQRSEVWISKTPNLEDATKFTDLAYPQDTFNHMGMRVGDAFYYWIRLVDRSGNFGEFFPDGSGTSGKPTSEALPYLEVIKDEVLTTETGKQLIRDGLEEALDGDALEGVVGDKISQSQAEALEMARLLSEAERHIREDEDAIVNRKVEVLEYEVNETVSASITHLQEVVTNAEAALSRDLLELQTQFDDNLSGISQELTTLATADQALAESITNLEARVEDDIAASISTLQQTMADADSALAQSITNLEARVEDDIAASIDTLQQTMADADQALAQSIADLTVNLGDVSAGVIANSNAIATTDGKLSAQYNIKTQLTADGQRYWAGIGLGVENTPDGPGFISQILLQTDRVALLNAASGTVTAPFVVERGQTFIDSAVIQDASITSAKIGEVIESDNFVANTSGWQINKNGTFQLNGPGGSGRLVITNNLIRVFDSNNVMRVRMGIW